MNKKELIKKLKEIKERIDSDDEKDTYYYEEDGHIDADKAILDFINDKEIEEVYDSIPKWYS